MEPLVKKELKKIKKEIDELEIMKKEKEKFNEFLSQFPEMYELINATLRKYCDLREDYYNIVTLWIIGTYIHKSFNTYPYLFINAMKGSGKTRLLSLIKHLSYNGKHIVSPSEAVLFRTAKNHTICIDEFESIGHREKSAIRELLNAAYKKGIYVERAKKVKSTYEENYEIEKYDVYCPIAMANIWGMENVLSDRCINLILEKSDNPAKTKLIEDFENDTKICMLQDISSVVSEVKFRYIKYNIIELWNMYVLKKYINYNIYINNNNYTNYNSLFERIEKTKLDGRNLELFFPLFIIAWHVNEEILNKTIETATNMVKEKKTEDIIENRDVALIDFISQMEPNNEFILVGDLTRMFKEFLSESEDESKWINSKSIGRALKRLNLITEKRRVSRGIEVRLNYNKAREKILIFKEKPDVEEKINVFVEEVKNENS